MGSPCRARAICETKYGSQTGSYRQRSRVDEDAPDQGDPPECWDAKGIGRVAQFPSQGSIFVNKARQLLATKAGFKVLTVPPSEGYMVHRFLCSLYDQLTEHTTNTEHRRPAPLGNGNELLTRAELRYASGMDRETIISEIKRTAVDGKPLGRLRLQQETGIRPIDWMRYWSRFGDAQRAAGFEPNERTAAYDEAELCRSLALLARELGRFPTQADLRVKGHSDPSFPSLRTFDKRLGAKPEIVAKVTAYCSANPEFSDVLAWCAVKPEAPEADAKADTSNDGFVYLLKSGRHYKIGKTNSVGMRERQLQIQLPEQARTVHAIKTDDPSGIEAYWHRRFEAKRKNGEWFELTAQDVAAFRRRKFM